MVSTYSRAHRRQKEVAALVYHLELPEAATVTLTIGRLSLWSNYVLIHLAGDGFANPQHLSQFFWSAKNEQQVLYR